MTVLAAAATALLANAAWAQLLPTLPRVADGLGRLGGVVNQLPNVLDRSVQMLADARLDRIAGLVRAHPDRIVRDPNGFPARAGEVIVTDPEDALPSAAAARGIRLIERGDTLGVAYARFALPQGMSLKAGIATLRQLGARDVSADQLYMPSGRGGRAGPDSVPNGPAGAVRIGMIDGGVAGSTTTQRGFASGAPRASAHGTAVASLIVGGGGVRGAAPGARLLAADVYGTDPAGGNASAIGKALGWLVEERAPVVTISLVGPANPLLGRIVAAAQARGTVIVAAVGNDGPASPLAYPASYPGVVAVTAVDGRKRILIEAGRASHLDYAAPGADMAAESLTQGSERVRGTSYAAPLVAATIALSYPAPDQARRAAALARVDAGAERRDRRYGRGIVCGACATPAK